MKEHSFYLLQFNWNYIEMDFSFHLEAGLQLTLTQQGQFIFVALS